MVVGEVKAEQAFLEDDFTGILDGHQYVLLNDCEVYPAREMENYTGCLVGGIEGIAIAECIDPRDVVPCNDRIKPGIKPVSYRTTVLVIIDKARVRYIACSL